MGAPKMNVIWIVSDTFRRDHVGAYGNPTIRTPSLDALAANSVRFDGHYAAGFPTMPSRADHLTGRWTMSFMGGNLCLRVQPPWPRCWQTTAFTRRHRWTLHTI